MYSRIKTLYISNQDYARQQAENVKKNRTCTDPDQSPANAKNNNILTRDPKLNEYFTTQQQNELYDFLSGYMAVAINSSSFSYTGDQNNAVSKKFWKNF